MLKKKIAVVFGTRPEAIKLAPVIQLLKDHPYFSPVIINTGQHIDLLDVMLPIFDVQLDYDLKIMAPNQSLGYITAELSTRLTEIFSKEKPSAILVQGDTTTAFVASLIGFYHKIPVGHVEAGLRSFQKYFPFPEESNRRLIGTIADWHFAPTEWSANNLRKEGIADECIHTVGNTVVDAMQKIIEATSSKNEAKWKQLGQESCLVLLTAHRRENFGQPMENIFSAVRHLVDEHPHLRVVYPVHPNPNVHHTAHRMLSDHPSILLCDPFDYVEFLHMMKHTSFVLTDSGGIQEEAPVYGKPVLILRDVTERPEGVHHGVACLVGTNKERIIEECNKLIQDRTHYQSMSKPLFLYGDGQSAKRILEIIAKTLIPSESILTVKEDYDSILAKK